MPLTCPHCQIVQAEGNETCINCGQPVMADGATAPPADDATTGPDASNASLARRASWRLPAAVVFCLLLALAASAFFAAQRGVTRRTALHAPAPPPAPPAPGHLPPAASATPVPPAAMPAPAVAETPAPRALKPPVSAVRPAVIPTPAATPLTVTLASTREGRHVKVGEDVTLTVLIGARSATLTLSYRRGRGKKTMLSFAEGSLCSTTWTPALPGRYEFTATALDGHKQADSRPVEILVDAPAPPVEARARLAQSPRLAPPPPAARPPLPRKEARDMAVRDTAPDGSRRPAMMYHVAAAKLPFLRSATILADVLSRRGYSAVPERMADAHGKTVYVVVTGTYRRPKEARAAVLDLQRSGYQAYFFGSH